MSIYPVKLKDWYPVGDDHHDTAIFITEISKCYACGNRTRWKNAIAQHSLPYGYGDIWCSEKCLNSGKIAKLDKRQLRKSNRLYKRCL